MQEQLSEGFGRVVTDVGGASGCRGAAFDGVRFSHPLTLAVRCISHSPTEASCNDRRTRSPSSGYHPTRHQLQSSGLF
jgi:hypothetical protein